MAVESWSVSWFVWSQVKGGLNSTLVSMLAHRNRVVSTPRRHKGGVHTRDLRRPLKLK